MSDLYGRNEALSKELGRRDVQILDLTRELGTYSNPTHLRGKLRAVYAVMHMHTRMHIIM